MENLVHIVGFFLLIIVIGTLRCRWRAQTGDHFRKYFRRKFAEPRGPTKSYLCLTKLIVLVSKRFVEPITQPHLLSFLIVFQRQGWHYYHTIWATNPSLPRKQQNRASFSARQSVPKNIMKQDDEQHNNEDATSVETHDDSPSQTETSPEEETSLSKDAIEDMTRGMVYASLAITDDKENTLKKVNCCSAIFALCEGHHLFFHLNFPIVGCADWKSEPLAETGAQDCDRLQRDCVQALEWNSRGNEFETWYDHWHFRHHERCVGQPKRGGRFANRASHVDIVFTCSKKVAPKVSSPKALQLPKFRDEPFHDDVAQFNPLRWSTHIARGAVHNGDALTKTFVPSNTIPQTDPCLEIQRVVEHKTIPTFNRHWNALPTISSQLSKTMNNSSVEKYQNYTLNDLMEDEELFYEDFCPSQVPYFWAHEAPPRRYILGQSES